MMRFAILSAVSTKAQAKETSLDDQINACRTVASKGWQETAGPFVISGQSRNKYLNLRDAENEISALRLALESARRGEYDILCVYDHDRLRSLLMLIYHALSDYGVQLYSLSQPIEPQNPEQYDPYANDSTVMMLGLSDIKSSTEISRMRRKYRVGMRDRITVHGLPVQIPYGYRKPLNEQYNRKAIPEPIPEIAPHLVEIARMYLRGQSIDILISYLEEHQLPPPHGSVWYAQTIRSIFHNPFYSGSVQFEKSKVVNDRRFNVSKRDRNIPADKIITAQGKHQPIWDEAMHFALGAELKRRTKNFRGRMNNQFTSLLRCGDCDAIMWRFKNGPRVIPDRLIWRCPDEPVLHPSITHPDLMHEVASQLKYFYPRFIERKTEPPANARSLAPDLKPLITQRKRLEDAYLRGLFDIDTFERRIADLDKQIKVLKESALSEVEAHHQRDELARSIRESLGDHADDTYNWLIKGNPSEINRALHLLLDYIIVRADGIELVYK